MVLKKRGKDPHVGQRRSKRRKVVAPAASASSKKVSARRSIKELNFQIPHEYLGQYITPLGGKSKAAVMALLNGNTMPKFSLQSGIQKWQNGIALFVNVDGSTYDNLFWVHPLDGYAPGAIEVQDGVMMKTETVKSDSKEAQHTYGDSVNKSDELGTSTTVTAAASISSSSSPLFYTFHMSWFAQNRQSNETPVIVEMVNQTTKELLVQVKGEGVGIKNKKGTNKSSDTKNDLPALERNPLSTSSSSILSSSSPSSPSSVDAYLETTPNILLFCRNQAESPAYVYCGRVQYINHDLSVRPIRFEWRLLDYPSLLQESQTQIHADSSSGNTQAVKLTEKTVKKRERGHTKQDTGDAGDREPKFGLDALFKLKREGD